MSTSKSSKSSTAQPSTDGDLDIAMHTLFLIRDFPKVIELAEYQRKLSGKVSYKLESELNGAIPPRSGYIGQIIQHFNALGLDSEPLEKLVSILTGAQAMWKKPGKTCKGGMMASWRTFLSDAASTLGPSENAVTATIKGLGGTVPKPGAEYNCNLIENQC